MESQTPALPKFPLHTHSDKAHGANSPRSFWPHTLQPTSPVKSTLDTHWHHPSEGGNVSIHSEGIARDLIEFPDVYAHRGNKDGDQRRSGNAGKGRPQSHPNFDGKRNPMSSVRDEFYTQQATDMKTYAQKVAQEKAKKDEIKFKQSLTQLQTERSTIVREIDDMLELQDRADYRKKEKLHREWHEKIYDNVQKQIQTQVDSLPPARYTLVQSITVGNGDTVARKSLRYNPMIEMDPTRKEMNKLDFERTLRGEDPVGPPRQREVLDPKMWSNEMLEATPHYDRAQKIQSSTRKNARNKTNLVFDHYGVEPPEPKPKGTGKRVYPKTAESQVVL